MKKSIFYFEKLNTWDKVTITLYSIISLFIWRYFNDLEIESQKSYLSFYTFFTQFFLYLFNYKSLRNLSVYFIWIGFSLIHLYAYYYLKDIESLHYVRGHAANGLKNTIVLLLVFQVFRFLSAKIQYQELICPGKGNSTDLFNERKPTIIDWVSLIIYGWLVLYL